MVLEFLCNFFVLEYYIWFHIKHIDGSGHTEPALSQFLLFEENGTGKNRGQAVCNLHVCVVC